MSALWLGVGLAVLLGLTEHLHFEWTPTPGLHSWASEHRHPLHQQVFWFYALILGAPFSVFAGHVVWSALASVLTRSGLPDRIAGRAAVLSFLPLLGVWVPLSRLDANGSLSALKLGALAGLAVLAVAAGLSRFVAPSSVANAPERAEAPTTLLPAYESRSLARTLRLLFVFFVLPVDLYLACFDPRIDGAVDLFHEGEQLVPLLEVLRGGLPYRDVYLQHGFLENLGFPWLGATLFAPTLAGVRWMDALVAPLGEVGAYALLAALTGARVLPAVLFAVLLLASPAAVSGRAFFGLLSIAVLAWSVRDGAASAAARSSRGALPFLFSGALAMVAFLHSTEVGLYSLATGLVFLAVAGAANLRPFWPSRAKPLVAFVSGAVLAWMPFGLALAAHGVLDDFFLNLVHQTRYQLEIWGKAFPSPFRTLLPLISGESTAESWADRRFWWYLCPAMLAMSGAWLAHVAVRGRLRSSPFALPLLLLSIAAAFYFRSVLGRSDPAHLQYGVVFPLLLAAFVADALWCQGRRLLASEPPPKSSVRHFSPSFASAIAFLSAAAVAVLALAWVERAARPGFGVAHAWSELVPARKRITFDATLTTSDIVPESQLKRLHALADVLAAETVPGERVFDFTNQAARLFFADRRSATRYFQIVYATPPDMQKEIVDRLDAERTRFVLMRPEGLRARSDGVSYRKRYAIVAEYVSTRFSPYRTAGGVEVWRRNDARP